LFEHARRVGDPTFIANAEAAMKAAKRELDALALFKSALTAFTRYYEFMSQIVDYDSDALERLSLYARHLAPLLREQPPDDDPIDLSSVALSHYRLSKIRRQDLMMVKEDAEGLYPVTGLGTGKARDKEEELLSQIIDRLNELFVTDALSDRDMISYAYIIRDKMTENQQVMQQITNNTPEQALLGDFPAATDDAVIDSGEAHRNLMMQYLNSKEVQVGFQRVVFDLLLAQQALGAGVHAGEA
jgi:type I restriction enzyme R subunit